jgi:hypothetical protein
MVLATEATMVTATAPPVNRRYKERLIWILLRLKAPSSLIPGAVLTDPQHDRESMSGATRLPKGGRKSPLGKRFWGERPVPSCPT